MTNPNASQPILYVIPHQDDLELSMDYRAHLEQGYEVHALLVTTGENSGLRDQLGMSRSEFTWYRDDEQIRAARRNGLRYQNLHIHPQRVPDGTLTPDLVRAMVTDWSNDYYLNNPGARPLWVKTLSERPVIVSGKDLRHPDHEACGQGVLELQQDGFLAPNSVRLFVEPYFVADFRKAYPSINVGTVRPTALLVWASALKEYQTQDGVGFKKGLGWQSVSSFFNQVYSELTTYYYAPPTT